MNTSLSTVTVGTIEKLIRDTSALYMDKVSDKICLLSHEQRDDVHSPAVVTPITPSIQSTQGEGILKVFPMVTLDACRLKVSFDVKISSNRIVEYSDNGLQSIELNVFHVPEMTNHKAFDPFVLLDGFLYILVENYTCPQHQ